MKIKSLTARPILDSRGEWTVEATIELTNGTRAAASVPQGKSTGSSEAVAIGAPIAVRNIQKKIAPRVMRATFHSQEAFDRFLITLDGTPNKSKLGANAILASSIAFARATAITRNIPLWKYVREMYRLPIAKNREVVHPRLFVNLINGGVHGGGNLDVQEYVVIPRTRTFSEAVRIATEVDHALRATIARTKGREATNLGDEGGFAPDFKDNVEPLRILHSVVHKLKLSKQVDFGMDAAATEIKKIKPDELADMYVKLIRDGHFIYLEDPFAENAFEAFAMFTKKFGRTSDGRTLWIAGDDLTTTNVRRMERAHAEGSVNTVIVKPNQIGSVTEALDATRAARKYGWAVIAAHRSGETNDDFIADFAYGVGADGLKLGAPARGERVAKYNRILAIEKEAAGK